jgi:proteasome lid subunit RPN8/RPN11
MTCEWTLLLDADTTEKIDGICMSDLSGGEHREACGFLAGRVQDRQYVVQFPIPAANISDHDQATHYKISASAFRHAEQYLQRQGVEIVGIYHSHPNGRADPSQMDIDFFFPGWVYLIIGVSAAGVIERKAFRISDDTQRKVLPVDLQYHG